MSLANSAVLLAFTSLVASAAEEVPTFSQWAGLSRQARREGLKTLKADQLSSIFAAATAGELIAASAAQAQGLGQYQVTLDKRERISGKLNERQRLRLLIRETPLALRFEVTDGPAKGRKVLYDSTVRKDELRVREAGLLSVVGAVWVGLNSGLTRGDTNHPATELGFSASVRIITGAFEKASPFGGYARSDNGLDGQGRYCMTFTAPRGAQGLYAERAFICLDTVWLLPMVITIDDAQGRLETFEFTQLETVSAADFSQSSL